HITTLAKPSSTAPSHTSRAECEPIIAIRRADGLYVSRTLRIASRPTIVTRPLPVRPYGTSEFNPLGEREERPQRNVFIGRFTSSHVGRTTGQSVGTARRRRRDCRPSGPVAGARPGRVRESGAHRV